jgi:WD40-like Beta Propeller Repeat
MGTGAAHFAMSSDGALIYVSADALDESAMSRHTLVWVDRGGREVPLGTPPRAYVYPRLSPDGTRVALDIRDQEGDIWIFDLARKTLTRLTFGPALEFLGVWTPDSREVIFSSGEFGGNRGPRSLFRRAADGTGTAEQLIEERGLPYAVTPDARSLIFSSSRQQPGTPVTEGDLMLLPLMGERRPQPLLQTPYDELNARNLLPTAGGWPMSRMSPVGMKSTCGLSRMRQPGSGRSPRAAARGLCGHGTGRSSSTSRWAR